jgi:ribosome-binding protein aMBF1 (putative translation factor)
MATELKLEGKAYIILPKAEYLRLRRGDTPPNTVDAIEYARASIGADLRAAREHAGLTQEQLATKLKKSQTMVSQAESGQVSVGARYVAVVLKACGLPKDWKPAKGKKP